ncbi:MAG: hypothetical protein GF353_16315 [Candidatus Lokiarchaeota archaeon]|nr:hypothetical protein [Candidatus Lokiarchaeota archaeon]
MSKMERLKATKERIKNKILRQEINYQFGLYIFIFLLIYLGSLFFPGAIIMVYILYFLVPFFLNTPDFITIFTSLKPLLALLMFPLVLIFSYLLRLFLVALFTRFFWKFSEKRSPSKNGIIPRNFQSKTLNYYHLRSFLIKYPKYLFTKGMFPWLINWAYNFIGSTKIGKGSTLEEEICGDKFVEIGDNCYIGVNTALASHLVEGIFGNVIYFKIEIGDNVTCAGFNIIGPGCEIKDDSYLLPLAVTTKYNTTRGDNYYFGMPLRRIFTRKTMKYLKVSKADLEEAEKIALENKNLEEED